MKHVWEYLDEALAVIIVTGCIILIALGIDSDVKSILAIASGWVFGKRFAAAKAKTK